MTPVVPVAPSRHRRERRGRIEDQSMKKRIDRTGLGRSGEECAAAFLRRRGFSLLEANYRSRLGEIDIVALDGEVVVFVEVKSKSGPRYGRPGEMLTPVKRRRLTRLALAYLQMKGWLGRPARFDVVSIDWSEDPEGAVRHYRNAFEAAGGY
jgi:putative endonuclease